MGRITFHVSDDAEEAFRAKVRELFGHEHGNLSKAGELALREWSDQDRDARNERKIDDLANKVEEMHTLLLESEDTHTHNTDVHSVDNVSTTDEQEDIADTGEHPDVHSVDNEYTSDVQGDSDQGRATEPLKKQVPDPDIDRELSVDEIGAIVQEQARSSGPVPDTKLNSIIFSARNLDKGDRRTYRDWKRRLRENRIVYQHPISEMWGVSERDWVSGVQATDNQREEIEKYGFTPREFTELVEKYDQNGDQGETESSSNKDDNGDTDNSGSDDKHAKNGDPVDDEFAMLENAQQVKATDGGPKND